MRFLFLLALFFPALLAQSNLSTQLKQAFKSSLTLSPLYFDTNVARANPLNPGNFLAFADREAVLQTRLDLSLEWKKLGISLSPRFELGRREYQRFGQPEKESFDEATLNEWRIEYRPMEQIRLGYGRDIRLWGPSTFYSISNPFFPDSGATNPYIELKGQDFADLNWNPHPDWTFTLIHHHDQGLALGKGQPFKRTLLLKADYIKDSLAASALMFQRDDHLNVGGYLQYTVGDALLLYFDGRATQGSTQLFPERASDEPLGWRLVQGKRDSKHLSLTALAGGAYTLHNGAALIAEFLHDDEGLSDSEQTNYFAMGHELSRLFLAGDELSAQAAGLLANAGLSRRERLSRNYLLLQVNKNDLWNRLNLIALHYANLTDGSSQTLLQTEATLTSRLVLLTNYIHEQGSVETHFGQYFANQLTIGLRYYVW